MEKKIKEVLEFLDSAGDIINGLAAKKQKQIFKTNDSELILELETERDMLYQVNGNIYTAFVLANKLIEE
jgi:hypothetical protein